MRRSAACVSPRAGTVARAIPASAPAAFDMIRADTWLTPAISTTEYIIVTSTEPTYGLVSPDATVETMSFGTPIGSRRIAVVAIAEPPEPPSAPIASSRPSEWSRVTTSAAPRAITSTAAPRSPAAASAATSPPAAAATSARVISGCTSGSPTIPASTRMTSSPSSTSRSRRYPYSLPFVSSVPTSTTVFRASPPITIARRAARHRGSGVAPRDPLPARRTSSPLRSAPTP